MGDELIKYNPFGSYRVGQREVVEGLIAAYEKGDRVVELCAGTGSGKTLSMVAAGRAILDRGASRIVYTTPLIKLVEQLGEVKEYGIPTLVGKANYPCLLLPKLTADECPFKPNEISDSACVHCPYRKAKNAFYDADYASTTMARFLFDPGASKDVDVVMIDESDSLENSLLDNHTLRLHPKIDLDNLKNSITKWSLEMQGDLDALEEEYSGIWLKIRGRKPTGAQLRQIQDTSAKIKTMERNIRKCRKIIGIITSGQEYFVDSDRNLRLIHGRPIFKAFAQRFKMVVLASGTPTTHLLCREYTKISAPHPIEVTRRKVYVLPVGKMSAKSRNKTAPLIAAKIGELHREDHKNTLVHCNSYGVAQLIQQHLDRDLKVIVQTPETRVEAMEEWSRNRVDTIFLSVNYTHGVDLAGERFPLNIIANVPYPYLGDEWVQRRSEYDNQAWFINKTAVAVQQAAGRCTRTPTDFSRTFILDSNFVRFYNINRKVFQPWFQEALVFMRRDNNAS